MKPARVNKYGIRLHDKCTGMKYRNPIGGDTDIRLCKKMIENDEKCRKMINMMKDDKNEEK